MQFNQPTPVVSAPTYGTPVVNNALPFAPPAMPSGAEPVAMEQPWAPAPQGALLPPPPQVAPRAVAKGKKAKKPSGPAAVVPTYVAPGYDNLNAVAPYAPGPTVTAPTAVASTVKGPYGHTHQTVMAPANPLRGADDRATKAKYQYGAVTQMARIPTPADVATDPASNTLANRLVDPWYPAAGSHVPDFSGVPYEWGGYWNGNSILRGW